MKINLIKIYRSILVIFFSSGFLQAQVDTNSEIFLQLKEKDSLLFQVGFNTCNIEPFEKLIGEDFEFYHDKGGILNSKSEFIQNFKEGLCKSPKTYQSRRELIKGSLEVFVLKNKGAIYGAIQKGVHRFYEKEIGKSETDGNRARFTHLWLTENGDWKLARVLSYDHL